MSTLQKIRRKKPVWEFFEIASLRKKFTSSILKYVNSTPDWMKCWLDLKTYPHSFLLDTDETYFLFTLSTKCLEPELKALRLVFYKDHIGSKG